MIRILSALFFMVSLFTSAGVFAQAASGNSPATETVEMADVMRADGKIYVVVAIVLLVLAGIFIYLFLLDRKVKRLETLLREKK